MKKLSLLTKTLLVAAGLLMGANAWGQIIYSWEGGDPSATETGGTAVASDEQSVNYSNTANQVAYKTIRLNGNADFSTSTVTITLSENTLQAGDVIRVTGYRNNSDASKTSGFKAKFNVGSDNVASSSGTDFNNIYSSGKPNTFTFEVPSSAAGSSTITMTRSHTETNLFITKIQVVRPVVNADINFSNAISDGAVAGTVNSMALSNTSGNNPFEKGYNGSNTDVLRVGNGTGDVTIPDLQLAGARDEVILTFDYYFGHLKDKYAGFYLYDESSKVIGAFYYKAYDGTASTNTFVFSLGDTYMPHAKSSGSTDNANIINASYKITFEVHLNYSTGKMYAKQYANGTLKQTTSEVSMGSTKPLKQFTIKSSYSTDTRRCWFDNLYIKTIVGDYSTAKTITYAYKDNSDNDITDFMTSHGASSSDTGELDEEYTPTYPSSVTTDDYVYDYTYASGGDAFTVTSDKTITLIYNKTDHPTVDVKLKRMIGGVQYGDLITVAEDYLEGKPIIYGFSKYIIDDGKLYKANAPYAVETAASSTPIEITYTEQTVTGTPVYFGEKGGAPSNTEWVNYSGGTTTSAAEVELIPASTLSDGFYTFEIVNNRNRTTDFMVGDTKVGELAKGANAGALVTSTFENVRVSGGPKISVVKNSTTVTDNIDYVLAIKTAPLNVTATINPTYGYATFSSDYALDFTSVTNLTAWIATGANGDNVALEQVTGTVAAGTGLILNGVSADIPVVAEGDTKSDNKLFAITSNYNLGKADNENYTNYVLAWQNSQVVFAPITGENYAPVVKGQAALCLQTSGSGGARALRFSFGGITGVENVEAASEAKAQDGKFIENGKIVIVKNGVKYNAAGQQVR